MTSNYDINKIKRLFKKGKTPVQVAEDMGISRFHLFRVMNRMGYNIVKHWRVIKND